MTLDANTEIEHSQVNYDAYQNHEVFKLINKVKALTCRKLTIGNLNKSNTSLPCGQKSC